MNKTRTLLFGSLVAGAMLVGIVLGATVLAKSSFGPANVSAASTIARPDVQIERGPNPREGRERRSGGG